MFERFTERARKVVTLAQDEARSRGEEEIDLPHLLIGLLYEEDGLAARVLVDAGATVQQIVEVAGLIQRKPTTGQIPFTADAKKALELSLREALALGHNYIGTEHVLLGIIRVDPELVDEIAPWARHKTMRILSGPSVVANGEPALTVSVDLTPTEISQVLSVLGGQPLRLRDVASAYLKLEAAL